MQPLPQAPITTWQLLTMAVRFVFRAMRFICGWLLLVALLGFLQAGWLQHVLELSPISCLVVDILHAGCDGLIFCYILHFMAARSEVPDHPLRASITWVHQHFLILITAMVLLFGLSFLGLKWLFLPGIYIFFTFSYVLPRILLRGMPLTKAFFGCIGFVRGSWFYTIRAWFIPVLVTVGAMGVLDFLLPNISLNTWQFVLLKQVFVFMLFPLNAAVMVLLFNELENMAWLKAHEKEVHEFMHARASTWW